MVNTITKMRRSNVKIRKWLESHNYSDIYFFSHSRFSKGFNIEHQEFDGVCINNNIRKLTLFQCKSNMKIPKKTLKIYRNIAKTLGIECIWANSIDRKGVEVYE